MNILSLGDLLLDVVIQYDPSTGEADNTPEALQLWPGGSAANFAVGAARHGANVSYVSQVGRDWSGDMLVRSLEAEGVLPYVRVVDDTPTGRVLVMVDHAGVRRMFSYPGASANLDPDDLDPSWFRNLDAFHLTGYSFLRTGPSAAAFRALDLARTNASPLCTLDPNPSHLIAGYGPTRYRDLLHDLQFDIIFPSLEEGRLLSTLSEPESIAADLLNLSPLVALTMGADGCIIANRTTQQPTHFPAHTPTQVVDTTGAGDAFAAAFVIEYIATQNWHTAARKANQTAAQTVSRNGAR